MNYTAILSGTINSEEIIVKGAGTIIDGLTEGVYSLEILPLKFNPHILKGILITGYPNACSSIDGSINIFKDKSYVYKRRLSFNNGGVLEMTANCKVVANELTSVFTIQGNLPCEEEIENSEPIIETWQPTTENKLSGLFRIIWKTKSGGYLSADAHSIYEPGGVTNDLPILHRYIEISSKIKGDNFSLRQNSMLFRKLTN